MNNILKLNTGEIYNPKIPRYERISRTDKSIDSNGWTKIVEHDNTDYFKNYSFSQSISGNGWNQLNSQKLPSDISNFDSNKMSASLNCWYTDSAGIINASIQDGQSSIAINAQNKYGSPINGSCRCNFIITVYS